MIKKLSSAALKLRRLKPSMCRSGIVSAGYGAAEELPWFRPHTVA
jgi:hypothetical protein